MIKDMMRLDDQTAMPALSTAAGGQRSLRELTLAELKLLSLPRKRVSAGTLVMRPETATDSLYFVMDGRVNRLAPTGEQVFQAALGPGNCPKCPG